MFHHFTLLYSDSEIAQELDPDMVPSPWDPDNKENRSICAEMILEPRENKKLDKATSGIFIRLMLY